MYTSQDIKNVEAFIRPAADSGLISDPRAIVDTLKKNLGSNSQTSQPETYMSKAEVMRFYNIHRQTLYQWIKKGWLTPLGFGRTCRFRQSEVFSIKGGRS